MDVEREIAKLAVGALDNGSPDLLRMSGRVLGLGEPEQQALLKFNIPSWFWGVTALAAGVVIGIEIQTRWPDKVPSVLRTKK